jgi:protein-S-isoprenylcysteine O-methyltransferase Ste14
MQLQTDVIGLTTLGLVLLAWVICGVLLLFRKKPRDVQEAGRAQVSRLGIGLQTVGFALVWALPRPRWWPFAPSTAAETAVAVATVALAYGSAWLCVQAIRTLGKQWTYQARVIEGHELVTHGPYALVRNPIYLGMFGAVIATGLAFSRWWTFLVAVVFFLIGNGIRIRAEERLLRQTFGAKFDQYAARVPPFFPRLF